MWQPLPDGWEEALDDATKKVRCAPRSPAPPAPPVAPSLPSAAGPPPRLQLRTRFLFFLQRVAGSGESDPVALLCVATAPRPQPYYWNKRTGEKSWQRPTSQQADALADVTSHHATTQQPANVAPRLRTSQASGGSGGGGGGSPNGGAAAAPAEGGDQSGGGGGAAGDAAAVAPVAVA